MADNKITLDKALAEKIETLVSKIRSSTVELATIASNIRNQYFDETSKRYDVNFQTFWKNYSMENNFGSMANFTKYAKIGDALGLVRAQYEQYEKRLPTTAGALYEFAQLTHEEMEICLEDTFTRTEVSADRSKWKNNKKKPKPLITPTTTEATIRSWRKNWREPKQPVTDKRRLPLAELKLHGSFYDFKNGVNTGLVSVETFDKIIEVLKQIKTDLGEDIIRFDIHEEKLRSGYAKRELASMEKKKKDEEKAEAAAKKKPSTKKKRSVRRLKSA
jgi:hypothetical protein